VVHAGNQIHLTPINSTLQLSPNLAHYDKYHEKPTEEKTAADIKPDKTIQMSLKRSEDTDVKEIDQAERRKQFAMEPWTNLNVFNESCIESQDLIHSLYSSTEADISCLSSPREYLDMLSPKLSIVPADVSGKAREQYLLPRTGRLNNDVKGLGLDAIVENLMVNGISFTLTPPSVHPPILRDPTRNRCLSPLVRRKDNCRVVALRLSGTRSLDPPVSISIYSRLSRI
jgi:hypothetical protein